MRHEERLITALGEMAREIMGLEEATNGLTSLNLAQVQAVLTKAQEAIDELRTGSSERVLHLCAEGEGQISNEEDSFFAGEARISISNLTWRPSGQAGGALVYQAQQGEDRLVLHARSPLRVRTYLPVRQATAENPSILVVYGQGQMERSGDLTTAEFTLWICDGGEEPNSDRFQIIISCERPGMNHASGLMVLHGQVEIAGL